jgi:hypothetical protein
MDDTLHIISLDKSNNTSSPLLHIPHTHAADGDEIGHLVAVVAVG